MTTLGVETALYDVIADEQTVWQQGNLLTGNTLPGWSDDWEINLAKAQEHLAAFTTASHVVRISPSREPQALIDLDTFSPSNDPEHPLRAEGVVTTNPNHVLFVNPADCGEIAVHGIRRDGQSVLGLFHASRAQVATQGYIPSLEYLCRTHDIEPAELTVRVSPSVRVDSYAFPEISDAQKRSPRWREYIAKDSQGLWHVNVHDRMLADLALFGIQESNMTVSPDDTAHPDTPYFSYSQSVKGNKPDGGNGLLFALRS